MKRKGGWESQGRSKRQGPETAGTGQPEGALKRGEGRARALTESGRVLFLELQIRILAQPWPGW